MHARDMLRPMVTRLVGIVGAAALVVGCSSGNTNDTDGLTIEILQPTETVTYAPGDMFDLEIRVRDNTGIEELVLTEADLGIDVREQYEIIPTRVVHTVAVTVPPVTMSTTYSVYIKARDIEGNVEETDFDFTAE